MAEPSLENLDELGLHRAWLRVQNDTLRGGIVVNGRNPWLVGEEMIGLDRRGLQVGEWHAAPHVACLAKPSHGAIFEVFKGGDQLEACVAIFIGALNPS